MVLVEVPKILVIEAGRKLKEPGLTHRRHLQSTATTTAKIALIPRKPHELEEEAQLERNYSRIFRIGG